MNMESSLVNKQCSSPSSSCHIFSLDEIKRATNDFREENRIGDGWSWIAYRGNSSGGQVSVKRFHKGDDTTVYFQMDKKVLTARRHDNIISLLGICEEEGEKIIVHEFMPNGTLYDYIENQKVRTSYLTVEQRLEISIGVAKGLAHLHSDNTDGHHIIHCDFKSNHILLDEHLVPKITGLDLSMSAGGHTSSQQVTYGIQGTQEYSAPETYGLKYIRSRKSNVYTFGVILLELLCERRAWDGLISRTHHFLIRGELRKRTPEHVRNNFAAGCARACEQLITYCLEEEIDKRPDMNQVVCRLELALKQQKQKQDAQHQNIVFQPNTQQQSSGVNNRSKSFSLAEIQTATNDYSERLGKGGQGEVFKGEISDESNNKVNVAVKCMSLKTNDGTEAFKTEKKLLSACDHANIISLLGFCDERDKKILVYEFMPKGTLYNLLHDRKDNDNTLLTVEQRLEICIGVAKGLGYLHSHNDYKIIHSDIKTENILLDANFVPKISDFGLSRFFSNARLSTSENVTSTVRGTEGYIAPECYDQHMTSRKADVFAFGVVLLEVLSEKKAWTQLVTKAQQSLFIGELPTFVHEHVRNTISPECSRACADLLRNCLDSDLTIRPSMSHVIAYLEFALTMQTMNTDSNSQ